MSKLFVRVTLKDVAPDQSERSVPIQLDLAIDESSRKISGNWYIFGVWGSYKDDANDITPVILLPDGRLDFGSSWEADRYGECDIRTKKIEDGAYIHVEDDAGDEYTYRISKVSVMGEVAKPNK